MREGTPSTPRFPGVWGALLLLGLVALIGSTLTAGARELWPERVAASPLPYYVAYVAAFGGACCLGLRRRGTRLAELFPPLHRPVALLAAMVPLVVGLWVLEIAILAEIERVWPLPESVSETRLMWFPQGWWLAFVVGVLAGPFLEEVLFRGVILPGLLERYPPAAAIAISALLFGAVHGNRWLFAIAFASGLVGGWLFYRTGSLLPAFAAHAATNWLEAWTVAGLAGIFGLPPDGFTGNAATPRLPVGMVVLGTALFVLGIALAHRAMPPLRDRARGTRNEGLEELPASP